MLFAIFMSAALKSTLVLGAAWLVAWLLRGRSAAVRHLVWVAAATVVLALPLLSVWMPALPITVNRAMLAPDPNVLFRVAATALGRDAAAGAPVNTPQPARTQPAPRVSAGSWIVAVWAAGALAALLQMLVAFVALWRLRRVAEPFADSRLVCELQEILAIRRHVRVLETEGNGMPMTFGFIRPIVFMPSAAASWCEERRRLVLLHELAHVRRADVAAQILARTALSVYWWNPLAWIAWREFQKERERATDDLVLSAGARATEYAGHLLEIARTMQASSVATCAALAMAQPSQLEDRLMAILDVRVNRSAPGRAAAAAVVMLAIAIAVPLAALRAQTREMPATPVEVDATMRAALAQRNYHMLERAAEALAGLRRYDEAQKLLDAALEIRKNTFGEQSTPYAAGLVTLGDLAKKRGRFPEAADYYTRAVALGDRPEVAEALLFLAAEASARKDATQATEYLQRAMNVAGSGPLATRVLILKARLAQAEQGREGEAESLYRTAVASAEPNSAQSALAMESLAEFLSRHGRVHEAEEFLSAAAQTRKALVTQLSSHYAGGEPLRVGGGVGAPKLLAKVEPEYTEEARAAKYQGTAVVTVVIGPDGKPYDVQLVRGIGYGLDEKAAEAVNQWAFAPATRGGLPVAVQATIEVNFRLM